MEEIENIKKQVDELYNGYIESRKRNILYLKLGEQVGKMAEKMEILAHELRVLEEGTKIINNEDPEEREKEEKKVEKKKKYNGKNIGIARELKIKKIKKELANGRGLNDKEIGRLLGLTSSSGWHYIEIMKNDPELEIRQTSNGRCIFYKRRD